MEYKQPVIGRPAAPLPYRATHPLQDGPEGSNPAGEGGMAMPDGQLQQGEQQEEPQYVTPLPADDLFEGVDAELMKDAERFGRLRAGSEVTLVGDGRNYCDDDGDDDDDDGNGDGDGDRDEDDDDDDDNDVNRVNALRGDDVDDDVDDDDDDDEQNVEEEEDDNNGEEIVLEADTHQFDDEEDNAYDENNVAIRSNGAVPSYHWK